MHFSWLSAPGWSHVYHLGSFRTVLDVPSNGISVIKVVDSTSPGWKSVVTPGFASMHLPSLCRPISTAVRLLALRLLRRLDDPRLIRRSLLSLSLLPLSRPGFPNPCATPPPHPLSRPLLDEDHRRSLRHGEDGRVGPRLQTTTSLMASTLFQTSLSALLALAASTLKAPSLLPRSSVVLLVASVISKHESHLAHVTVL
jgi:hypothetical protein